MQKVFLDNKDRERYARHLNVPEIGETGQILLKNSSAIVVGMGGLGSASSIYLTAAGVGRIGIVDFDQVGLSNLQRQILYSTENLGKEKINFAKKRLEGLNPEISIEPYPIRITDENVEKIIKPYSYVVDATDNLESRFTLNRACVQLRKPFIYGAIYQFYGQLSVFNYNGGPCLRCIFREPRKEQSKEPSEPPGVVGAVPGTIGTLQAMEVIKLIINQGKHAVGRLILYDGLGMAFEEIRIEKNPECPVCGKTKAG
jgi:molybdopterin/thiamine biosynthesis adenylyltransferase